jgi:hypothetical protein
MSGANTQLWGHCTMAGKAAYTAGVVHKYSCEHTAVFLVGLRANMTQVRQTQCCQHTAVQWAWQHTKHEQVTNTAVSTLLYGGLGSTHSREHTKIQWAW